LKFRAFGRTSLREIKRKLEDVSLTLGMQLPPGVDGSIDIPEGMMEDDACCESDEECDSSIDECDEVIGASDENENGSL
jgi:hypothetical protein